MKAQSFIVYVALMNHTEDEQIISREVGFTLLLLSKCANY